MWVRISAVILPLWVTTASYLSSRVLPFFISKVIITHTTRLVSGVTTTQLLTLVVCIQ